LLVCFLFVRCPQARAAALYNNTSLTGAVVGINPQGLFDEVLIPSSIDPSGAAIAITQVTVGVNFSPGTGNFKLWAAGANNDTSPAGTPFLISSQTVTSAGFFSGLVTFGDGVTPMAVVTGNSAAVPGFVLLYLGLTSDNVLAESWQWANGPSTNLPTAYFRSAPVPSPGIYLLFPDPGPGFPSDISFSLNVQGNPVPEPPALFVTGLAGVCAIWPIRRQMRPR
jgi:hypothetical protein